MCKKYVLNNILLCPAYIQKYMCHSSCFCRLVEEVYEINETVESLKAKLREAENALQHLLRTKASLEQDLSIKNNSLFIDREKCMGMRKTFPMSPRVAAY